MHFQTNIFPITNLDQLTSQYRLYRIGGLNGEQDDYFSNCQIIIRRLSYQLGSPITIVEHEGAPHLVVKSETENVPATFHCVRRVVEFEAIPDEFTLDYTKRSPENDVICIRFLQFILQAPLQKSRELWQLGSGQPFFYTEAYSSTAAVNRYLGFSVRVVVTHTGGLGFCVDATNKFVARRPLPTQMNRDAYARWHEQHCIYHYGYDWFNIKLTGFSDYDVSNHKVATDKGFIPLLSYINDNCKRPLPPELARLRHDASVVLYQNNRGEERSAPTPLCYPVLGSSHRLVKPLHRNTLLRPYERRELILEFVSRYLTKLEFGDQQIRVARKPTTVKRRRFDIPDIEFGKGEKISTNGTEGATHTSVEKLGKTRDRYIRNQDIEFFVSDPLVTQYLIIPESVADSYGESFKTDLSSMVNTMFPQEYPYAPIVVTYNDRVPNTFLGQGSQILTALDEECQLPGYALVMIHHTDDKNLRQEDQLAGMVMAECRKRDITASVIHSEMSRDSYTLINSKDGNPEYVIRSNMRRIFIGYLNKVALNHVLLNNERWPFVLATPTNADITIGIDVKYNTAGLLLVGARGQHIRILRKTSKQKEQLNTKQIQAYLIEILNEELEANTKPIKQIVIHRDGRMFDCELEGCKAAIQQLIRTGKLDTTVELTVVEIPKTSPARFRLFEMSKGYSDSKYTNNPHVGNYYVVGDEGYVCSTGRPFVRQGTAKPLHAKKVYGTLPIEQCLEDIYHLTALTWSMPEGCIRTPITIGLNDRFLREIATEYDSDALYAELLINEEIDFPEQG